ncbi:MAG: tRNA uridine-5-carboxymethylaminomethyl(34) synthesis GTPase MnmE [Oscillospiraceae bacterium]|jgi:tRNA modification GTPase|nr:tRNA uridine-5-carboxymethylaminomethyl(34) synthesis GTPase MnmE [Oscillospiraceae bacterium]
MERSCDTIAAISTAASPGGIGIVRISGDSAIFIAKRLFHQKNPIIWSEWKGNEARVGSIRGTQLAENESLDACVCLLFRAPKSYTCEDVVEFHCHGGTLVLRRVLLAVLAAGARAAAPGEFTRRAFLNGRIDLAQAEAVMRLVGAQTEQAARAAKANLSGTLSRRIEAVRSTLTHLAAEIAAWVDYPEDMPVALQPARLGAAITAAISDINELTQKSEAMAPIAEGVETVLLGRPNVGKSTLMNHLLGYDRSIVTEFAGTTRDTVSEMLQFGNLSLRLIDTAGICAADDPIEREGVARSRAAVASASLVFCLLDASRSLGTEDEALLRECDPMRTVLLCNKSDLGVKLHLGDLKLRFRYVFCCSAKSGKGLEGLPDAAAALLNVKEIMPWQGLLSTQRQFDCAKSAANALLEAQNALLAGFPLDAVGICLEDAIQALLSLTGERASDAVVDAVFASFCVGK